MLSFFWKLAVLFTGAPSKFMSSWLSTKSIGFSRRRKGLWFNTFTIRIIQNLTTPIHRGEKNIHIKHRQRQITLLEDPEEFPALSTSGTEQCSPSLWLGKCSKQLFFFSTPPLSSSTSLFQILMSSLLVSTLSLCISAFTPSTSSRNQLLRKFASCIAFKINISRSRLPSFSGRTPQSSNILSLSMFHGLVLGS